MSKVEREGEHAVEKALGEMLLKDVPALKELKDKNFAPRRSIRELIEDLETSLAHVEQRVHNIKERLNEFYRLQSDFYNGKT